MKNIVDYEKENRIEAELIRKMSIEELDNLKSQLVIKIIEGNLAVIILIFLTQSVRFLARYHIVLIIALQIFALINLLEKFNIMKLRTVRTYMDKRWITSWVWCITKIGICFKIAGILLPLYYLLLINTHNYLNMFVIK